MTKRAINQKCETDPAICSKSERERERELCRVTRDGYVGLVERYIRDFKVMADTLERMTTFN